MIATLTLLAAAFGPGAVWAEETALPRALLDHALAHGCREVRDFSSRPGVHGRPFVYGYVPESGERSAAYWCETGPAGRPAFRLMLLFEDPRHALARCASHIEWGDRIGGLSIDDATATMDGFIPLDHRAKRPPKGTPLRHPAIRSDHETGAALFYCHEGVWFVRMQLP